MSFDSRLFGMDMYSEPAKKNGKNGKNGKGNGEMEVYNKKCFGDECFDPSGFFGGFSPPKSKEGIPQKADVNLNIGLEIPELGAEFNTRIGKIGTGFTEAVDPYNVGFKDILTGNGRTGEIIGYGGGYVGGGAKRGRGRPRKERSLEKNIGSYRVGKIAKPKGKPMEIKTKEVREAEKRGEKTESRSVYQLIKEGKPKPKGSFQSESVSLGRGTGKSLEVEQPYARFDKEGKSI